MVTNPLGEVKLDFFGTIFFLFKENFYQGLDMDDFCMETTNIEANSQLMLPPFSQVFLQFQLKLNFLK